MATSLVGRDNPFSFLRSEQVLGIGKFAWVSVCPSACPCARDIEFSDVYLFWVYLRVL